MGLLGLLGEIRRIRARRAMDLIAIVARVRDPIAAMQPYTVSSRMSARDHPT